MPQRRDRVGGRRKDQVRGVAEAGERHDENPAEMMLVPRRDRAATCESDDDDEHDDECRKKPERTTRIKVAQRDAPLLEPLLEEELRDQKATENEEQIDAEVAGCRPAERMERDHRGDRQTSNPVECGPIAEAARASSSKFTTRSLARAHAGAATSSPRTERLGWALRRRVGHESARRSAPPP